ncbi:AraC family transcriptional regulator [Variovorax sp. 770b2]|uniref:helix-turn-helix transcriptional regulator n=1 Tax=Variovorax sp. 770b2 TaxID=1566271 RepID=UPI0008F30D7A|nr:AraC family transcriptional regulator [Variovorax sp. 770b2]SFQ37176.1 AraC-type DNA-binding protein [Variovorax sp. 770b2]
MGNQSHGLQRRIDRVPHLAAAGTTIQTSDAILREMAIDYFLLVLVRCGKRSVRRGSSVCTAGPGDAILMTPGTYDVTNFSDGPRAYRSDWLAWDASLVNPLPDSPLVDVAPVDGARLLSPVDALLEDGFEMARNALGAGDRLPPSILKHRVLEVLIWLREHGFHLVSPRQKSLGDQIRTMVVDDPSADWNTSSLAAAFSMSEATLRRRLGAESTSFKQLVSDARMGQALNLLLATDLPVYRVALDSGYSSTSHFATRFRARFGLAPSQVRGNRRGS